MKAQEKTKEQLIIELKDMQKQLTNLKKAKDRYKQAEERLEQLRRRNDLILNSAGEGIYGLDRNGLTTFVNPAAARMLGWAPEELHGKPQHAVIHHTKPDGQPYPREECPIYAAFKDGKVHLVNNEVFWRKDRTSFPVEYTILPMDLQKEKKGALL
ncbi:MAG: PAS domain-containing protein [bacterium]